MERLQRAIGFETAVTLGLAFVGIYLVANGVSLGLGSVSVPEAGSFTFLAGIALTALSLLQLVLAGRRAPAAGHRPEDVESPGAWHKVVALFAALALYTAVLDTLGFIVATILLSAAVMKISHRPSWRAVSLVSVGASIAVYVLFHVLLGVSLPAGTLFQR